MNFAYSDKVEALRRTLTAFMGEHVLPHEHEFEAWIAASPDRFAAPWPKLEELKQKARAKGLWNLFLPDGDWGAGLTNLEYAPLCEIMGRSFARARGLQLLGARHRQHGGAREVRQRRAEEAVADAAARGEDPLGLRDDRARRRVAPTPPTSSCRSAATATRYVINGRKWWITGAPHPLCKIFIVMGKTDPDAARHEQQSMILVPRDTPGVEVVRPLTVFGYDDAPHGHAEVRFEDVRVPAANLILGEGRGFEIAQGRLGPGRIHHCMRVIGMAERALELMCRACARSASRSASRSPSRPSRSSASPSRASTSSRRGCWC